MKISIIGTGNVATILGKLLYSKGFTIAEIFGRDKEKATQLAYVLNTKAISDIKDLNKNSDVYIIALSDAALVQLASQIQLNHALVLHTAGSVNKSILQNCSSNYGVLYPVQSIRKDMDINTPIPFMIDGNNDEAKDKIFSIANSISPTTSFGNDEQRLKLHVAAVFACNFSNYMYMLSNEFCSKENIDFKILQPLIEETATRLRNNEPQNVLTGPAKRKDTVTIQKHISLLQQYPQHAMLYKLISELIMA